jgi:hypothetical protein
MKKEFILPSVKYKAQIKELKKEVRCWKILYHRLVKKMDKERERMKYPGHF